MIDRLRDDKVEGRNDLELARVRSLNDTLQLFAYDIVMSEPGCF